MPRHVNQLPSRRRSVNLTIRKDVMETVKALRLNASKAAEAGIIQAIREAQEHQWRACNGTAIDQHNERIEQDGPLLMPGWTVKE
ncbi:MAG: type II toxin-antitoxin system CcdA family antitoxin [Robiginitomaculum sp.]|nr:type II toxin-antitoxin system CcdA family antitoxin [Robiginitomaculum sp.]MDQ7077892.1 type II toxin-antitoxin system CcdA family antitoxin [Robiginitomaculum sp.]